MNAEFTKVKRLYDSVWSTFNYMKNSTIIHQVLNKLNEISVNISEDHLFFVIFRKLFCVIYKVRLPNSVFQPYASVATNLLFFTKGSPTKEIWYYEHTLPEGQKSYSKTKLIRKEEFEPLKKMVE